MDDWKEIFKNGTKKDSNNWKDKLAKKQIAMFNEMMSMIGYLDNHGMPQKECYAMLRVTLDKAIEEYPNFKEFWIKFWRKGVD